jgi:DNA-binding response OmpR family regulator
MRYCFMACEVDDATYQLRRDGQVVPLQPQAFTVLCYLLRQRHRVVPNADRLQCLSDRSSISSRDHH